MGVKMEWRWRGTQMESQDRLTGLEGSGWLVGWLVGWLTLQFNLMMRQARRDTVDKASVS